MADTPRRTAATFDEYLALMVEFITTSPDAVNEHDLIEWCFQKWHGGVRKAGYAESTVRAHAKDYDRHVGEGVRGPDRKRKTSPRLS